MSDGYGRSTEGFGISRDASVELIIKTAIDNKMSDPRQIAYVLATAQHETKNFIAAEEDFGRQQARKFGYRGGENYYGRGYVHLTHIDTYQRFDKHLALNGQLAQTPNLAKQPDVAAKILIIGMQEGLFTGKTIGHYINDEQCDYFNARRVISPVMPAKVWTIKAAKECKKNAEIWETKLASLLKD